MEKEPLEYDEAIRLDPDNIEAYLKRSDAYFANEDYDKALEDYNRIEKLISDQKSILKFRGLSDEFVDGYLGYCQLAVYENRAKAYFVKKDYDKVIENCIRFLEKYGEDDPFNDKFISDIYKLRGEAYKAKGDTARAEADLVKAKKLEILMKAFVSRSRRTWNVF